MSQKEPLKISVKVSTKTDKTYLLEVEEIEKIVADKLGLSGFSCDFFWEERQGMVHGLSIAIRSTYSVEEEELVIERTNGK